MRTKGTEDLSSQPPGKKWKSLFGMFKEWRQQTNIAHGAYVYVWKIVCLDVGPLIFVSISVQRKGPEQRLLDSEILKVREAIVALRQRKDLTDAEQELFRAMQARLRALNDQRTRSSSQSESAATSSSQTHSDAESPRENDSDAALLQKPEAETKPKKEKRSRKESATPAH